MVPERPEELEHGDGIRGSRSSQETGQTRASGSPRKAIQRDATWTSSRECDRDRWDRFWSSTRLGVYTRRPQRSSSFRAACVALGVRDSVYNVSGTRKPLDRL